MAILMVQMTQISNMKVIGLVVDFLNIIKLWHLSIVFMVRGNFLPKVDEFYKINHKADNFHI